MEMVEKILQSLQNEDMDVTAIDENGNTSLHQVLLSWEAEETEVIELLQLLLDQGVDPNTKNASKKTALHLAVEKRMRDAVDLLIEFGARKDVTDNLGNSIAHHFIENEYIECIGEEPPTREKRETEGASFVEFMISRGFDFDRRNYKRQSALHRAATNCHLQRVLLALLEYANDIDFTREHNITLLHLVLASDDKGQINNYTLQLARIMKLLLDHGVPVEAVDESGRTALYTAIDHKKDMSVVKMIGDRLLDVCRDSGFASYLFLELISMSARWHLSGTDYFFRMLRALLAKGADVNVKDKCGQSPIHFAAESKALGCLLIELILGEGCDVNAKDDFGHSALYCAARCLDNASVVRLLIESGCDVNAKDNRGNSALHVAARHSLNIRIVRLLIESGAVVDCKNKDLETPLHWAVKSTYGDNTEVAQLLLVKGANVNGKDVVGRAALSYAASAAKLGMLKLLLRSGACVNARDGDGITVLFRAYSNLAIVKELFNYGAEVSEDCAIRYMQRGIFSETRAFIDRHCIMLQAANLRCSVDFISSFADNYLDQKFYEGCLKEVETLKTTFVDSRTSLYNFLHKLGKNRYIHIRKEKLQTLVDSPVLEEQFPRYATLIRAGYRDAVARKLLVTPAIEAWQTLTEAYLPDICVERIFDYLSTADLIDLAVRHEDSS